MQNIEKTNLPNPNNWDYTNKCLLVQNLTVTGMTDTQTHPEKN